MTLTRQAKVLDDRVKANKAQYDLHRKAAKISALSSRELEKYEYLTVKDLGYKPDVIQKAKFEYSLFLINGWMKLLEKRTFEKIEKS